MDKFGADKQRTGRGSKFARSTQWPNDADRGVSRKKNRRAATLSTATWLVVGSEQPEQHKGDLRRRVRSSDLVSAPPGWAGRDDCYSTARSDQVKTKTS